MLILRMKKMLVLFPQFGRPIIQMICLHRRFDGWPRAADSVSRCESLMCFHGRCRRGQKIISLTLQLKDTSMHNTHRGTHTHTWIDIVNHGYIVLWFLLNFWHVWSLQVFFGPCWTCRLVVYQCITVPSVDQIPGISETHCYTEEMFHDSCLQKENWRKKHYDTMSAVNVSKDDCWHCCVFGWQREGTRLAKTISIFSSFVHVLPLVSNWRACECLWSLNAAYMM